MTIRTVSINSTDRGLYLAGTSVRLALVKQNGETDQEFLFRVYRGRCVHCGRKADQIHEIVPRSKDKDALRLSNRVALCQKCHEWAHPTHKSRERLRKDQAKALMKYGSGR